MGCDIHTIAEVRKDGEWKAVTDKVFWDSLFEEWSSEPYSGRNYLLFGILAGVRNFDVDPIAKPRGTPLDASEQWLALEEEWGADFHTISWLTVEEMLAYPWAKAEVGIRNSAAWDCREFMGTLAVLRTLGDPWNVRLVFGFDN